jgi:hypothetical protein
LHTQSVELAAAVHVWGVRRRFFTASSYNDNLGADVVVGVQGSVSATVVHSTQDAASSNTRTETVAVKDLATKSRTVGAEQKSDHAVRKEFSDRILDKVKKEVARSEDLLGAHAAVKVQIDHGTGHVDTGHVRIADKALASTDKVSC